MEEKLRLKREAYRKRIRELERDLEIATSDDECAVIRKKLRNVERNLRKYEKRPERKDYIVKIRFVFEGEAANARRLLEKLLNSYGLTLEQILAEKEEKHWFKFKATKKWEKKLCFQCYYKVMNVSTLSYKEYKGYICYELTAYEFAEIQNLFEWHKTQLGKELKQLLEDFTESYCIKHSITSDCSNDDDAEAKPLSPQERQRLLKIMMLVDTVEDTSYRKMIE